MDGVELSKIIYTSMINGFIQAFNILWTTDEFKSIVIGAPVSVVTYWIVGEIFSWGRSNGIWFGRRGGKLLNYLISTFLVWVVMKIV